MIRNAKLTLADPRRVYASEFATILRNQKPTFRHDDILPVHMLTNHGTQSHRIEYW